MSGRWVAGIVAVLVVGLVVFFVSRPPPVPAHVETPHTEEVPSTDSGPTTAPTPAPATVDVVAAPPQPEPQGEQPRTRRPDAGPLPPPIAIPVVHLAPVTAPNHENVAGLARQVCARAAARDAAGLAQLFGPGWRGHVPMDELRDQCSGDPTAALLTPEGEFNDARTVFGEAAVRHWATESGLDAAHCYGLHVGNDRVMACQNHDGQYLVAVIDFQAPQPRPPANAPSGPTDATAPPSPGAQPAPQPASN